jgi:hypothetical protein
MARIEWVLLCERAFLDHHDRACLMGVVTHFRVPSLPFTVANVILVAKLIEARPGEELAVGVGISTPRGWTQPTAAGFDLEQAGEYLFVTLHQVPLSEAATYRFALALGAQEIVVEIPVTVTSLPMNAAIH